MKWLNRVMIPLWAVLAAALLIVVSLPKGEVFSNPIEVYSDFLPGEPMQSLREDPRCDELISMSVSVGLILICTPGDDDKYVKRIYVIGWDNQINSSQFYFKPDQIVLGNLVTWYSRWNTKKAVRNGIVFIRWADKSYAIAMGGWHGLFTKINCISFIYS